MALPFGIDPSEVARTLSFLLTGAMIMWVLLERKVRIDHLQPCYCPVENCAHCYHVPACPKCGGMILETQVDNHGGSYEGTRIAVLCSKCGYEPSEVGPDTDLADCSEKCYAGPNCPHKEGAEQ